jgi:hypothetical protein
MEPTPTGRLATMARAEAYRHFEMGRKYPPDFADFYDVLQPLVEIEILSAKLNEARLKPANEARIKELLKQLAEIKGRKL